MAKLIKVITFLLALMLLLGSLNYLLNLSLPKEKITKENYLQVDQFLIKVLVKEGSNFTTQLKVMNVGGKGFNGKAETKNLPFVSILQPEFYIDYGQTIDLSLEFVTERASLKQEPGVYVGKLILTSDYEIKEIPIIVGIESEQILFSINLNIPPESRQITRGTSGLISVTVYNLKKIGPASIVMSYFISDVNGNKIVTERESIVVEDKTTFTKVIPIPENILEGDYVFTASANYGTSVGVASHLFEVVKPIEKRLSFIEECTNKPYCLTLSIVALIIIISTIQYIYFTLELSQLIRSRFKKKKEERHVSILSIFIHGFYNYLASFYRLLRRIRRLLTLRIQESEAELKEEIIKIKNQIINEKKQPKSSFKNIAIGVMKKRLQRLEEKRRLLKEKEEAKEREKKREISKKERKRKIKEFFRKTGFYKTPQDRRRIALEQERRKQEELRKKEGLERQKELERQQAEEEKKIKEEESRRQRELEEKQRDEEEKRKREEQRKQDEIKKLLKQIEDWKKLGYDTTILELETKALDNKELRKLIERLKEWKSKGYNTLVLEEKIKRIYGNDKKSLDATQLEIKIKEWKTKGYNTSLLEEKLKNLKNK